MVFFELIHRSSKSAARVGRIHTPHGTVETPAFVPVATNAALKAVDSVQAAGIGIDLLFCNTYHLLLHPGPDVIAACGGLHAFMQRDKPIITDSGGFQVFSLLYGGVAQELKGRGKKRVQPSVLSIDEEGVLFRSYRDGSPVLLTPESSVQVQKRLHSDLIIPLDELPPYHASEEHLKNALERTHRWEERSLMEHKKDERGQHMYGVLHGGLDISLRTQSAHFLSSRPFDGYAIGGSLGKSRHEMVSMLRDVVPLLDPTRPRHLLGVGDCASVMDCIPLGLDSFDSSHPTKCARHGLLFTAAGCLKIRAGQYKSMCTPIDHGCCCLTCQNYSVAYLHHLFKVHEAIAHTLASIHNLFFMQQFFNDLRQQILNDKI